jgi:hypothetical protein
MKENNSIIIISILAILVIFLIVAYSSNMNTNYSTRENNKVKETECYSILLANDVPNSTTEKIYTRANLCIFSDGTTKITNTGIVEQKLLN